MVDNNISAVAVLSSFFFISFFFIETERDDVNNFRNVFLSDPYDSYAAELQLETKAAKWSVQQVYPNAEISPKVQNQSNFVPPLQWTDGDDYKFIEIIEHFFQVNETEGDPSSCTDLTAVTSQTTISLTSRTFQSSIAQFTDNDDNNFLDTLDEICRDCSTES